VFDLLFAHHHNEKAYVKIEMNLGESLTKIQTHYSSLILLNINLIANFVALILRPN